MSIVPKISNISVIIPTLDEEARLAATLGAVVGQPGVEVLVVDGGSQDATVAKARAAGVRVLSCGAGRGRQMNAGATVATGDILLFLHGDTVPPPGFADLIRETLARPGTVAGAFRLAFAEPTASLRLVAWGANLRSRWLRLPYGDQGLFVGRGTFAAAGGFPEQPILEDVALVRRLRRRGRVALAGGGAAVTSPVRWQRRGVWGNTVRNQLILLCFFLGFSLERLAGWYRLGGKG
ncbi:MAG: TIGR04283 family arsenosugar biosynthesis glycosyltransferase [Desulfobulbaceae bacterium]|nr:TIGR04283 family arsenosugar biosynthesis glycosyltransferase [Desulfobulbaceae bacterium]